MTFRLIMPVTMLALSACTASNGTCVIPQTEAEIHTSLKRTGLRDAVAHLHLPYDYSESYLRDNPHCCTVTANPVDDHGPLLTWDDYSRPQYYVRVAAAAKSDDEIRLYTLEGAGDACGRIPDPIGSWQTVAGGSPNMLHQRVDANGRKLWPPLSTQPQENVTSEDWQPYPWALAARLWTEKLQAQRAERLSKH